MCFIAQKLLAMSLIQKKSFGGGRAAVLRT